jgi:hypothetical protein
MIAGKLKLWTFAVRDFLVDSHSGGKDNLEFLGKRFCFNTEKRRIVQQRNDLFSSTFFDLNSIENNVWV